MSKWVYEYLEACKMEKEAQSLKKKYRAKAERFLRLCKRWGIDAEARYDEVEKFKLDEEATLSWISVNFPNEVHSITKIVLDYEKLQEAVMYEKISLANIPDSCYSKTKEIRITPKRKLES